MIPTIYKSGISGSSSHHYGAEDQLGEHLKTDPLIPLFAAVQLFRQKDADIQAQTMALFLLVASKEGISMADAAEELNISQSSISRNASLLSRIRRRADDGSVSEQGLDLIIAVEDPYNRRQKVLELTGKGKMFAESLKTVWRA